MVITQALYMQAYFSEQDIAKLHGHVPGLRRRAKVDLVVAVRLNIQVVIRGGLGYILPPTCHYTAHGTRYAPRHQSRRASTRKIPGYLSGGQTYMERSGPSLWPTHCLSHASFSKVLRRSLQHNPVSPHMQGTTCILALARTSILIM